MQMTKWFVFCAIAVMLACAAADSEGAEYDYPGQVYNVITTNSACYSSKWWYDVDGEGPDEPQWVATLSCFTKSAFDCDEKNRMGWVHNVYIGVDIGGAVVDVKMPALHFTVTDKALIKIAGVHWYTYAIDTNLVRSSLVDEQAASQDGPQILVNNNKP